MKKNKVVKKIKGGISKGKMVAVGAGMAAVGAVSAGAYYLLGPKGRAHQKKAVALMGKMKKDVMRKVAKAKTLPKPLYHNAVDTISAAYSKKYKVHAKEIKSMARELKSEFENVAKNLAKKSVKIVKKKF